METNTITKKVFASGKFKKEMEYWKNKLSGELLKSSFPYDFINTGVSIKGREVLNSEIPTSIALSVLKLSGGSDLRLHMILTAALAVLLYKYTGNRDIIVGTPIYNQSTEGDYINTILALRNQITGNMSFKQFLLEMRQTISEAVENQNYPIENLIDKLDIVPSTDEFQLFDAAILLKNIQSCRYMDKVNTNIEFCFQKTEGSLECEIKYNPGLYRADSIQGIMSHFINLLHSITACVDSPISQLDILSPEEKDTLLYNFNSKSTFAFNERDKLIHEMFEEQVEKTPEHIAITFEGEQITYRQLNEKSNKLAAFLRRKGVKAGDIVSIMLENSIEMAVGLLAILKSGGAYLPIDPQYPDERIKYMLEDSGARIALTQHHLADKLDFPIEFIDIDSSDVHAESDKNLGKTSNTGSAAYIIYTSGTTGNPKGVIIEHAAFAQTIVWRKAEYNLESNDVVVQLFSYSFDGFVTSFFTPIISGSKVVFLKNQDIKDPSIIRDCIKFHRVTHFICIPTLYMMILEFMEPQDAKSLRIVTLAGEKATENVIRKSKEINNTLELVNEYGPTENSVVSTIYRNMREDSIDKIGRPVANTSVYILDKDNNPLPVGVAGELCLSGDRLAKGYLNKAELTKEKFMSNIFGKGRMYRTGDLARWDHNGNLDFVGRIDHQVKIRGYRIELKEIETVLMSHNAVKEAVVIDRNNDDGNKYLCAYVVLHRDINISELRKHMKSGLPDYMIPECFVKLDRMPLTPNGKLDRKELLRMEGDLGNEEEYVIPANEVEERITKAWMEVLGAERVGINDNFFALGGNSFKAVQVVTKLAIDFDINVNHMFKYQTIHELSEKVLFRKDNLKKRIQQARETASKVEDNATHEARIQKDTKEYKILNKKYENIDYSRRKSYGKILLAGATGFLGIHILHDLLETTTSNVYLIVRGDDRNDAENRIKKKLEFYFDDNTYEVYRKRIYIFAGDITRENFGIMEEEYAKLLMEIDCIINSAASVKHYGNYIDFYNVNVKGAQALLDFAKSGKLKDYNHISTISVGSGYVEGMDYALFTENDYDMGQKSDNYYIKTKIESERLVLKAREEGLSANIFRVGNLVFNSNSGIFQENIEDNAFYTVIKSMLKTGVFPSINIKNLDFSYIDYVSKAITLLYDLIELKNETYHLYNSKRISMEEFAAHIQKLGFSLNIKSVQDFMDYVYESYGDNALKPYIEVILLHTHILEDSKQTDFMVVCDKTESILENMGFVWSEPNYHHIDKMMKHCLKAKFL